MAFSLPAFLPWRSRIAKECPEFIVEPVVQRERGAVVEGRAQQLGWVLGEETTDPGEHDKCCLGGLAYCEEDARNRSCKSGPEGAIAPQPTRDISQRSAKPELAPIAATVYGRCT